MTPEKSSHSLMQSSSPLSQSVPETNISPPVELTVTSSKFSSPASSFSNPKEEVAHSAPIAFNTMVKSRASSARLSAGGVNFVQDVLTVPSLIEPSPGNPKLVAKE